MGLTNHVLSRVKYWASRPLPPQAYWYIMGKLKPIPAVTSVHDNVEDCLASGEQVVTLLQRLGVVHRDVVSLHIGAGLGRVEYNLRQHVRKCYGIDISSPMVKQATELVPHDNVEFVHVNGPDLSRWRDGYFDLVYSFLVFQHLPRAHFDSYVTATYSKLKDGGHFVFQILIDESGTQPDPPSSHPYGIRYYRRKDVEELLRSVGFELVARTSLEGEVDDGSLSLGDVVYCVVKETYR